MNKKKANDKPKKLSAFERETEGRRREMLRTFGPSRTHDIPMKRLKRYIAEGMKPVLITDEHGNQKNLRRFPAPNVFRAIAREQHRGGYAKP